jgi:membrane protein required for colicin V production
MTPVDYAIILVFGVFSVWGLLRGLVAEVFSLASWVIGIWIGIHYGAIGESFLQQWLADPLLRAILGGFVIGVLAFAGVSILGALLSKLINASLLGPVNRMLGLFFGAARGLVIISLAVLIALQFELDQAEWWQAARLRPAAMMGAELLNSVVDIQSLIKRSPSLTEIV